MEYGRGGEVGRDTGMDASGEDMCGACWIPRDAVNDGDGTIGVVGAVMPWS
jgi:hypothetical protein